MNKAAPTPATLADLLDRIRADDTLEPDRQRDLVSSLRCFGRAVGRELAALPVDGELLRALIRSTSPAGAGISPKRWANIRSVLATALKRYAAPRRQWQAGHHLDGPWRHLRDQIPDPWERIRLCRMFRYLEEQAVGPDEVSERTFSAFERWLRTETIVRNPTKVVQLTYRYWNRAMTIVSGWPQVAAPTLARTDLYALAVDCFPPTFRADLEAWRAAMSGDDLFAERAPNRALRPATIRHEMKQLQRFASALVRQGVNPAEITSLAILVRPDLFKLGLRFFLERNGGKPTPGLNQMADILIAVARRWVEVDGATITELKRIAGRIECRQRGLTATNRSRLAQFDDPGNIRRLLYLPTSLVESAQTAKPDRRSAQLVRTALAISILLAAPLRLLNLTQLNLHQHVVRNGRSVRLVIERHETKNEMVLDYPLPEATVEILHLYERRYRPFLLSGSDHGWLFPGQDGKAAMEQGGLSKDIQKTILARTGLVMHVHLFRHLAGKLSLLMDPANYEQVRRLLGHRSVNTTTAFYTGFATDAAARRYHEQVLRQPEQNKRRQPKRNKAPSRRRRVS